MRFGPLVLLITLVSLPSCELLAQNDIPVVTYTIGSGTIQRSPDKSLYQFGETVTLAAVPARYYSFDHWSDGLESQTRKILAGVERSNSLGAIFTNNVPVEKVVSKDVEKWVRGFNGDSQVFAIFSGTPTADGFVLAGAGEGFLKNEFKTLPGFGFLDYWAIALDGGGTRRWEVDFGGSGYDDATLVRQTRDGGYVLVGYSESPPSGNKTAPLLSRSDYWMVRLTATGEKVWDRALSSRGDDTTYVTLNFVHETAEGGFLVGGDSTQSTHGGYDLWAALFDKDGNNLWQNRFGGTGQERGVPATAVINTADSGWIIGGTSDSGPSGNKTSLGYGGEDIWLIRIDQSGQPVWDRSFGGSSRDWVRTIRSTSDGGFIVGGNSQSEASGNKTSAAFGKDDIWLVRLDGDGNKLWDRSFGGTENDDLTDVQELSNGDFIVLGTSDSPASGNKTPSGYGVSDFWLIRTDSDGTMLWDRAFGGTGVDVATDLRTTSDGGFIMTGSSRSSKGGNKTTTLIAPDNDVWVVRLNASGVKQWEYALGDDTMTVQGGDLVSSFGIDPAQAVPIGAYNNAHGVFTRLTETELVFGTPRISINSALSNHFSVLTSAPVEMATSFPNGAIFYTLDGSEPGFTSTRYSAPITVSRTSTIRAIGYSADFLTSSEAGPVQVDVPPTFIVEATTRGGGTVSVDLAAGIYASNSVATITATPATGWTFAEWAGATNSTNANLELVVDGPKSLQAVFGTTLTGTVAGAGHLVFAPDLPLYPYGTNVVITAVPDLGYYLAAWGNSATGTNNPLSFKVSVPMPVVSALFVKLSLAATLQGANSAIILSLAGDSNSRIRVESSSDLKNWTLVKETSLGPNGQAQLIESVEGRGTYFRSMLAGSPASR